MMNLQEAIECWQAGDQRAAKLIYDQHREQTFRLAYALLGNIEDAEEVTQDALTYALLHIHDFDLRRSKFTTWLYMITVSRSRDHIRKRRLPSFSIMVELQKLRSRSDSSLGPEQRVTENETRKSVWDALQDLSPDLREATILRHWGDLTYQEIAEITGCTLKTAQSRVRLAHQKLVRILGEVKFHQSAEETR